MEEEDSEPSEERPEAEPAARETTEEGVPEGPKRPCPKCGSTKLSLLTKNEEVAAFYAAYGVEAPLAILTPPRRCRSCGHRWEVIPPKFVLLLAIAVFGVGLAIGLVGAITLYGVAMGLWGQPEQGGIPRNEKFRILGFAGMMTGVAIGSGYGIHYYWGKLRKRPDVPS